MKLAALVGVIVVGVLGALLFTRPPEPRPVPRTIVTEPTTAIARGRVVYEQNGCAMCHGDDGKSGIDNLNSETEGKVPPVAFVKEGYTTPELARYLQRGNPKQGKEKADGPTPPYRMPGGLGGYMTRRDATDLAEYLMSLYPKDAKSEKW